MLASPWVHGRLSRACFAAAVRALTASWCKDVWTARSATTGAKRPPRHSAEHAPPPCLQACCQRRPAIALTAALRPAELVNKLQRHPSSGRDDIKVLLRVLRDEIGRAYFKRRAAGRHRGLLGAPCTQGAGVETTTARVHDGGREMCGRAGLQSTGPC